MNKSLVSRLDADEKVLKTFSDFQSVVDTVPALKELATAFSAKITAANAMLKDIEHDNKAYTLEKNRIAEQTFLMGASLGRSLSAYATKTKNEVLQAAAVKTVSGLKEGIIKEVVMRIRILCEALKANERALADYKVSPDDIAAFVLQVAEFEEKVVKPRQIRDERVLVNQAFNDLISELSDMLRNEINDTVTGLKEKHEAFYVAFLQASKIAHGPTTSRTAPNKAIPSGQPLIQREVSWPVDFNQERAALKAIEVVS